MISTYQTLSKSSSGEFKDRGSKFYAFAFPVKSETEIKNHLEDLRKKYHDARHHCFAWKLGIDPYTVRSSDDGEPTNSAGKPILNQIESNSLSNVLIIVIRYFGGTLLGLGGLINAYRSAAREAIANNQIIEVHIKHIYLLKFSYDQMNSVMRIIKEYSIETFDQEFEISCSLKLKLKLETEANVLEKLELIDGCTCKKISLNNY
jgi:uncharacterized YigZ family protein